MGTVSCNGCGTPFPVDPTKISAAGTVKKCPSCNKAMMVTPASIKPAAPAAPGVGEELDLDAVSAGATTEGLGGVPRPPAKGIFDSSDDLPVPVGPRPTSREPVDLPTPRPPVPRDIVDLPAPKGPTSSRGAGP